MNLIKRLFQRKPDHPARKRPPSWAVHNCQACRGLGFNTHGQPCRICLVIQEERAAVLKAKP